MAIKAKLNRRQVDAFKKKVEGIRTAFGQRDANAAAEEMLGEMKDLIAKGISPILGKGRFPEYLHAGKKGKYPANQKSKFPRKRQRPVNLFLSGDFLKALKHRVYEARFGFGFEVGYFDRDEAKKEQGHREGVKGQPERPTIPVKGEEWNQRIQRIIFKRFKEAIARYVKKE